MLQQRLTRIAVRLASRHYATSTATSPPMLLKIRGDLKTAMRTKDTARLSVLRSLLASTLNASKTNTPITTDAQMLSLLRKTSAASRVAADEFRSNGREELAEREEGQIAVLEEYAGAVQIVGRDEVVAVVRACLEELRAAKGEGGKVVFGEAVKRVFEGETLKGRTVDKAEVVKIVKEILG